jgi:hypothetical protein
MDDLERYIKEHEEVFESEPPEGHAERFRGRLEHRDRRDLWRSFLPALRIAGVVLLFILSGLWILEHSGITGGRQKKAHPYVYEYQEAEHYYASQVNAKLSSIEQMHFLGDSLQKKILYNELSQMDSLYQELQKELKMNPGDERLLWAMTEYYQIKLDVLNNIIRQLSALQTKNKKDHETKTL